MISPYSFDAQSDFSNKELYSFFKDVELPAYVKTAELDDAENLEGLPKQAFADPERKIYPLNTPARVYVSNAYLLSKQADISSMYGDDYVEQLRDNLKRAADIFDISADLEEYEKRNNVKAAADYEQHYLTEFNVPGSSEPVQLYPVKTAEDLRSSAEHFVHQEQ